MVRLTVDIDKTVILLNDAVHRGKPQTGALLHVLGGEKRFEKIGQRPLFNAAAVRQARAKVTKARPGEAARMAKDLDGLLKLDKGEATERVEQTGGTHIIISYEDAEKQPEDAENDDGED